jgi:hypothetical protein
MLRRWLALAVTLFLAVLLCPRAARADQPGGHTVPVAVLGFDTEEADDQADALTGSLRSRVRGASGWSLLETTASLGMLTAGLKCSSRPNPECQQRIADQIKAERYIWGVVTKGPTAGQVTAEVHLFQKGKPDTTFKESFSDNLKDPQDEKGIGKISGRILERLTTSIIGFIVVRAGDASGEVVLDGEKRSPLTNGTARIEAAAGPHSVEVTTPGQPPTKRNVLVVAGKEATVDVAAAADVNVEPSKPFPTRKVLGGVSMAAGVGLAIVSVVSIASWSDAKSEGEELAKSVPNGQEPCEDSNFGAFCNADKDAKSASTIAWITGGLGVAALGVGAYLLFAPDGSSEKAAAAPKPKTRIVPSVGSTNGLFVTGSF